MSTRKKKARQPAHFRGENGEKEEIQQMAADRRRPVSNISKPGKLLL